MFPDKSKPPGADGQIVDIFADSEIAILVRCSRHPHIVFFFGAGRLSDGRCVPG